MKRYRRGLLLQRRGRLRQTPSGKRRSTFLVDNGWRNLVCLVLDFDISRQLVTIDLANNVSLQWVRAEQVDIMMVAELP